MGIYPGAKVVRGPDWSAEYEDQDGKNRILTMQMMSSPDQF